jgi:Ribonuclease HepT-like
MAGAGNVYSHDYEDVALSYVWTTLRNHLPPLRAVIQHELAVVDQPPEGKRRAPSVSTPRNCRPNAGRCGKRQC